MVIQAWRITTSSLLMLHIWLVQSFNYGEYRTIVWYGYPGMENNNFEFTHASYLVSTVIQLWRILNEVY